LSCERLREHRRIWERKPVLGEVYAVWFEALLGALPDGGRVLEAGAGPGFFSDYARSRKPGVRWMVTDVVETPWNDVVADALRLPFRTGSFEAVTAVDLIHHLSRPASFFTEVARVLAPGGRLAVVEPWVTPLSYPVYGWLHQEGCHIRVDPWNPFGIERGAAKDAFEGDSGVVWRMLRDTPAGRWGSLGFRPPKATILNGFAYLLTLGFRDRSLLPRWLAPFLLRLDRWAAPLACLVGMRVLTVWERA
jgi:SAM-dependent methyltransferase